MKAAAAILLVLSVAVRAQQTAAPQQRPVPAAVNTIAAKPEAFVGQIVSITASVDRQLSPTIFVVDHDPSRSVAEELLVVAPTLQTPVSPKAVLTIVGEVKLARDAKIDLAPEVAARYEARPVIVATSVVDPKFVDLARRVPSPMTPMEEVFDKVMKRIGPAFTELRTSMTASNAAGATEQVKVLKTAFADAEAFWKARGTADALEWNRAAGKHLDAIQKAVTAGDWSGVKTSVDELNRSCSACHGAYRERFDDGTYRVRASR